MDSEELDNAIEELNRLHMLWISDKSSLNLQKISTASKIVTDIADKGVDDV